MIATARKGDLELVTSPLLVAELEDVLRRQKFRRYVDLDAVRDFVDLVLRVSLHVSDPDGPSSLRSPDPDDDYLIALAQAQNAILVSGDNHLLDLSDGAPILAPSDLLAATL